MVEINVYLVQMICNQKPRKYASEINNNVLLCKNIYCGGYKCLCCTNIRNQKPRKYASEIDNIMFYYM